MRRTRRSPGSPGIKTSATTRSGGFANAFSRAASPVERLDHGAPLAAQEIAEEPRDRGVVVGDDGRRSAEADADRQRLVDRATERELGRGHDAGAESDHAGDSGDRRADTDDEDRNRLGLRIVRERVDQLGGRVVRPRQDDEIGDADARPLERNVAPDCSFERQPLRGSAEGLFEERRSGPHQQNARCHDSA